MICKKLLTITSIIALSSFPSLALAQNQSASATQDICEMSADHILDELDSHSKFLTREEDNWVRRFAKQEDRSVCLMPPMQTMIKVAAAIETRDPTANRNILMAFNAQLLEIAQPQQYFPIAKHFFNGDFTPKVPSLGLYWLEKASGVGDPNAQFELAQFYHSGKMGYKKNPKARIELEMLAAAGGSAKAMHNLGVGYLEGGRFNKNPDEGEKLLQMAAAHGYVRSAYILADAYLGERGYGIEKNIKQGRKYALIAARAGYSKAMILYASYLLQAPDSGKTKDQVFYWLNKAVDAGDLDAKRFMDERGAELSAVYERTKKPLNAYEPQKKCPMVKRCTSYQTNRGVETSKSCVAVPDYWNC